MANLGFIHEELDIKIFILYILKRLAGPVDPSDLFDLVQSDGAIGYFEYSDCLSDLVELKHIRQDEDGFYSITEKGRRNIEAVETDLPYSVRSKVERKIPEINEKIQRAALVITGTHLENGSCIADLSMSDGIGTLIEMHILCADEKQAAIVKKNFKHKAEYYYTQFVKELSEEN